MRIVFLMHATRRTGGHRTIFEYCNGLVGLGHEVVVAAFGFPQDHSWFPLEAEVVYSSKGRLLHFYNYMAKKIRFPTFDEVPLLSNIVPSADICVATFSLTANAVGRSKRCRARAYFVQHFEPWTLGDDYLGRWALETYHLGLPTAVNSTWLQQRIREETGLVHPVISPGIDLSVFRPRKVDSEHPPFRLLALAKPEFEWKGLQDLIKALQSVAERRRDFKLITFGFREPAMTDLPVRHRHVFSPSDDELSKLYSAADIVISPSWFESFPLPPLEAMACGSAVVTTRPGTEDYAEDMRNALVVPPREPAEMAEAILRLMDDDDLRLRIGNEAAESVQRFTWQAATSRMEAFLRSVVGE